MGYARDYRPVRFPPSLPHHSSSATDLSSYTSHLLPDSPSRPSPLPSVLIFIPTPEFPPLPSSPSLLTTRLRAHSNHITLNAIASRNSTVFDTMTLYKEHDFSGKDKEKDGKKAKKEKKVCGKFKC